MFEVAEAYERQMGRWSRQLAPLLVEFAGVLTGHSHCKLRPGQCAGWCLKRIRGIYESALYLLRQCREKSGCRSMLQVTIAA